MSRLNLSQTSIEDEPIETLDELIPNYALNKIELDSYKKICDSANVKIKDIMYKLGEEKHESNGWIAKRTVVEKESFNEDKLLNVIKKYNIKDVIKTKEYVDMDVLESYLYNNEASSELAADLASCKIVKEEIRLTISKIKNKENKQ